MHQKILFLYFLQYKFKYSHLHLNKISFSRHFSCCTKLIAKINKQSWYNTISNIIIQFTIASK